MECWPGEAGIAALYRVIKGRTFWGGDIWASLAGSIRVSHDVVYLESNISFSIEVTSTKTLRRELAWVCNEHQGGRHGWSRGSLKGEWQSIILVVKESQLVEVCGYEQNLDFYSEDMRILSKGVIGCDLYFGKITGCWV